MANYDCTLITEGGEEFKKIITAETEDELYGKIPNGSFLISSKRAISIFTKKAKMSQVDLLSFTTQFSSLVSSGVSIDDALKSMYSSLIEGSEPRCKGW